jgi:hypothetical protein
MMLAHVAAIFVASWRADADLMEIAANVPKALPKPLSESFAIAARKSCGLG